MTPSAATAAARSGTGHVRTRPRPSSRNGRPPISARRVSGPAGGARTMRNAQPAFAGAGAAAGTLAPPLGLRIARRAAAVPDARLLDRLIRGRAWIMLVAVMLIGLVFLQVSLLKLNSGIGESVATAQNLQTQNAELRTSMSRVDTGQQVRDAAAGKGMVLPGPADVTYLSTVHLGR